MSENEEKPVFDEQTLARVLEAAYVLQEHNRERIEREEQEKARLLAIPSTAPAVPPVYSPARASEGKQAEKGDYSAVLSQIVETQQRIQSQRLDADSALSLIVERATEITGADGAGIAVLDGRKVRYRAGAGSMALPAGSEVGIEKSLCAACLRVGQVLRCGDVNPEFLVDAEECRRRGIQALIAAPVYQAGNVIGGLELYYGATHAFAEPDVHTCQLMAGIVAEALGRSEQLHWTKTIETERRAVNESFETSPAKRSPDPAPSAAPLPGIAAPTPVTDSTLTPVCQKCGNEFAEDEQFCGECGLPRSGSYAPVSMQSKVAMLWQMQQAKKKAAAQGAMTGSGAAAESLETVDTLPADLAFDLERELPELFTLSTPSPTVETSDAKASPPPPAFEDHRFLAPATDGQAADLAEDAGTEKPTGSANWSSAASARDFLEQQVLKPANRYATLGRFVRARRGDLYLAVAVILVSCVIHWGLWPAHPANDSAAAAAHRKPGTDLPLFDRVLIKLGLAEAPPPPEYKGNPDTKVWVDVQTALYYCPGADLYGKTPRGKLSSQRDAQLDQYEPASRKACD